MGVRQHPLYRKWTAIRQSILNPHDKLYPVCHSLDCHHLHDFSKFAGWIESEIGLPPSLDHRLNRIDQFQGWIPGNVRWAVQKTVSNNRRPEHHTLVEYQGRRQPLTIWAHELGLNYNLLINRHLRGWLPEEMFTIPANPGNKLRKIRHGQ